MKDSTDDREREDALEQAVRDITEPPAAAELRAADVAETELRQTIDSSGLRRAADVLNENQARLRQTSAELRERERELNRTGNLVRDVERNTAALRSAAPPRPRPTEKKE